VARALRIEYPGAFYHVASRGNERKDIFVNAGDREHFLSCLESATIRHGAQIHVYCLMSNHYHLLVETPHGNLSRIMKHVNGAYTAYFNVKRRRAGHLFQGRYKAILVDKDEYAKELSRYIHLNPVRAAIVAKPDEYPWSSYRAYAGAASAPRWLHRELILSFFGTDERTSRMRYRDFVEGEAGRQCPNPFENVTASTLLGPEPFVEWVREKFIRHARVSRELPALRQLAGRPALESIRAAVEALFTNDQTRARRVGLYLCRRHTGLKLKEIGAAYGVGESAVTQASRRVTEEMKQSESLRASVKVLETELGLSRFVKSVGVTPS
jgi:REP element-mobilizing transposase RayT